MSLRMTAEQVEAHQRRMKMVAGPELQAQAAIARAQQPLKRSKYNSRAVEIDGYRFASAKEGRRYQALRLMEKAGEISDLKLHTPYELAVNGVKVCTYIDDFNYWHEKTCTLVVEDVKGYRHGNPYRMFKIKAALMRAIHGIDVVEL